jgi:3-deoxy-D-manno-octulosonic-acid transferase
MSARLWLWSYSLLMRILQPLVLRKLTRRARDEPLYGQYIAERWGQYSMPPGGGYVWLHAVSLGETRAAALLLTRLRMQWPGLRLLLTHGTATGREAGQALLQPGDVQVWQPWDTPAAVKGFLDHFRPRVGLLMETEVWPNCVHACTERGIPLVLVNARMSEKSARQARRLLGLSQPAYAGLSEAWAQTEDDARRLRELGVRVTPVLGNLKFDVQPDERLQAAGEQARAALTPPVVVLASSREGEEAAFLQALRENPVAMSHARWAIVPRHPQRFDEVAALMQTAGFEVLRRSSFDTLELAARQWGMSKPSTLLLGDSLGEMGAYSAMANATMMGGSFEPLGGQNLIEPLAYGSPVVVGPHTFNFEQATQEALRAGVVERVSHWPAALPAAVSWAQRQVQDPRVSMQCREFVERHAGAVTRSVERLTAWL